MPTRTAKGFASFKDTSTSVTLSSVSVTAGHSPIVIVGFHDSTLPTSVKAGTRTLNKIIQRVDSVDGYGTAMYYARSLKNTNTRDFVATWAATPGAGFIAVITVDCPLLFFEGAGNIAVTASPTTSSNLVDLPVHDCFHIAGFTAQGPTTDADLTFTTDWTTGQHGGTAGIPQASNLTFTEAYRVGRCIDPEECTSTGTDSRDYCALLGSFKPWSQDTPMDKNNSEIEAGDTVTWDGGTSTSTVSSITQDVGHTNVKVVLATGNKYNADQLEVV